MLALQAPAAVAERLWPGIAWPALMPGHGLPTTEIAGDFVLLDHLGAAEETWGRDAPLANLGQDWWVFACSGTGDAWLLSRDQQQTVAFLDHAAGPDALPQLLGIDAGQWLQLADLMAQLEAAQDQGLALAPQALALMEQLAPGLSAHYPYSLV
ncbi:hypothetical protein [Comamonas koreensis]|uniref:SMI1/KNR4 family protein n=1 Tax=Comamonas koreensis TaxID=160825 RepID=A0AAW4XWP7_9BURK|nr:hypothetical protein [Comamonas koreensis]MCD2165646.1 hypothetical protein [Comamonas koreensis]